MPNGWKEEKIASIEKKLEGGKVSDYRGVNLMPILYTSILAEKLIEEVEEKGIMVYMYTYTRSDKKFWDKQHCVRRDGSIVESRMKYVTETFV